MTVTITTVGAAAAANRPLAVYGRDIALKAFPLNSLVSTLSTTINDTTSVINTQDVLDKVLRLADLKHNRQVRTTPTMLDTWSQNRDAWNSISNPMTAMTNNVASGHEFQPNGAFPGFSWTLADGSVPAAGTETLIGAGNGRYFLDVDTYGGTSVQSFDNAVTGPHQLYFKFNVTEPLVVSPFVFSEVCEYDTGLFGINNIQLVMNLTSSPGNVLRTIATNTTVANGGNNIASWGSASYSTTAPAPFNPSRVNVQFLTPSLDVPLPPKSVVPYMEFPRYISQTYTCAAQTYTQLSSQTITLPQIPDLLIIWAKPQTNGLNAALPAGAITSAQGEFLLPLASLANTGGLIASPLSVNFDNFSGLLSSHTTEQLYEMSVRNGLEQSYAEWTGRATSLQQSTSTGQLNASGIGAMVPTVGGALVLKPGTDIVLQSGQAPSLVGNFTLQFNLSVFNPQTTAVQAQLYIITVNSGFFESIRGSSRIIKGVLSEQDIISAPVAPMGTRSSLERMVGGLSFGSLGNILTKAKDIYSATKPIVSAAKNSGLLPGGVSDLMGKVGYGASGGGGSGGGRSGGKKSLAERLM